MRNTRADWASPRVRSLDEYSTTDFPFGERTAKMMSAATAIKVERNQPSPCCMETSRENEKLRELVDELTRDRQKYRAENDELKTMVERLHQRTNTARN